MKTQRLLIVEDEAIVAKNIEKALKNMGFVDQITASHGAEAVQLAAEKRPHLVLMDIRLPGDIDGIETAKRIRTLLDIPVVFLTAYADEETLQRAKITQPYGYLLKPFEEKELHRTIEMALHRHEIDKKLKESEERYRVLFDDSPIPLHEEDFSKVEQYLDNLRTSGIQDIRRYSDDHPEEIAKCIGLINIVDVNKAALELYQAENKQAIMNYLPSITSEDSYDIHKNVVIAIAEGKTFFKDETFIRTLAGKRKDIILRWSVAPGYEKTMSRVLVSMIDITERKKGESELKETNARLQTLINAVPDAIYFKDIQGRNLLVNRAFAELVGLDRKEIEGKTDDQILPPELVEQCRRTDEAVIGEGKSVRSEEKIMKTDNETVYFETIKVPLHDDAGDITGLVGVSRDITERKRIERESEKLETQIRQVQKLESLGVLTGGIAHDFNNLLMGILGNADIALMELPSSSPACQHIADIKTTSQRAADLCKQMLAYSGKGKYIIQHINLNNVMGEISHLLEASISKSAFFRCELADNLPVIEADSAQIEQVIMNLIINASEAIADKTGLITLTTGAAFYDSAYLKNTYLGDNLPEGEYVYLEVSDTGCGMDRKTLSKIFDPFFTTKFTGRGLGLAAVIGIVRGHNGAIEVHSEPGSGTTIRILFPSSPRPTEAAQEKEKIDDELIGSGTVLIVDDEETILSVVRRMLESLGYTVLVADDGQKAIEILSDNIEKVDAVILDLTMPYIDGREVFSEMRQIKSNLPIILSSGYNEAEALQDFAKEELAGFIQKPYETASLVSKLKNAIEK